MLKLSLVPDWKVVLRHAWSVRLMIIAALLSGLEVALPLLQGFLPIRPGIFALLTSLVVAGAFVARFVVQAKVSGPKADEPEWDTGDKP